MVLVCGGNGEKLSKWSNYVVTMGVDSSKRRETVPDWRFSVAVAVFTLLAVIVMLLAAFMCLIRKYSHKVAEEQGMELSFRSSIR